MENEDLEPQEESVLYKAKVIFSGECDHEYIYIGKDPEGNGQVRCSKCPMGKLYKTDEMELKDGKLTYIIKEKK